jgi:hypothetical protein
MKQIKSFFSIVLVMSIVLGGLSVPVLAYEEDAVFIPIEASDLSSTTKSKISLEGFEKKDVVRRDYS